MKNRVLVPLALSVLAGSAGVASAAGIFIDGTGPSVSFVAGDFEGGIALNGSMFQDGYGYQGTTLDQGTTNNFFGKWIELGFSSAGSRTVYVVDPANPGVYVAYINYTYTPLGGLGQIAGEFAVGVSAPLPAGVSPSDIVAPGTTVDFSNAFLSATFKAPTPGAAALLGLAGLAAGRRRR